MVILYCDLSALPMTYLLTRVHSPIPDAIVTKAHKWKYPQEELAGESLHFHLGTGTLKELGTQLKFCLNKEQGTEL